MADIAGFKVMIFGGANIDIFLNGLESFPGSGELGHFSELKIAPGGKSRNLAVMLSRLVDHKKDPFEIHFITKRGEDEFGFTQKIIDSLKQESINTDHFYVEPISKHDSPGAAIIPVTSSGDHKIFVHHGALKNLSKEEILGAKSKVDRGQKVLFSFSNALLAHQQKAVLELGELLRIDGNEVKIFFDPGGIRSRGDVEVHGNSGIFLLKPNEQESKIITGIDVTDEESARAAGEVILGMGFQNVLLSVGYKGAYLVTREGLTYENIPDVDSVLSSTDRNSAHNDPTGCGDQLLAAFMASYMAGDAKEISLKRAVIAGTLQYYRAGVDPINLSDLNKYYG